MGYSIRQALETDLKQLAQMNKELIEDEGSRNPMSLGQLEERMADWLLGAAWEIEIIQYDMIAIGYAVYQIKDDESFTDEPYIYLR